METTEKKFILFTLDEQQYALCLSDVERVVRAVEVTPLPKAPEMVLGVVNVQGKIIPVMDIRKRFCLQERKIYLSDQLIIVHDSGLNVALWADSVIGVIECRKEDVVMPESIFSGIEYVEAVVRLGDSMVFICDLKRLLSLEGKETWDNLADACVHEPAKQGVANG